MDGIDDLPERPYTRLIVEGIFKVNQGLPVRKALGCLRYDLQQPRVQCDLQFIWVVQCLILVLKPG